MLNKKYQPIFAALAGVILLSGCANTSEEETELANFSSSVSEFTNYIKDTDSKLNELDVNNQEAVDELLAILDDMDAKFSQFAELEAPAQYGGAGSLADEASEHMSLAVSYYHSAYEAETFDQSYSDAAYRYYELAMEDIKYIGYILSGDEIPENDRVTVYEEANDSHILDKWLSDDSEDDNDESTTEAAN
ncbi:MAG: hypothetical protein J6C19_06560 [Lachnospiraceae bacterium]|nr:hypothetical protein [Lachnospiraceae bacterium]MBO5145183.1 hypothetical protein [Lachnospiraceae bacterium]